MRRHCYRSRGVTGVRWRRCSRAVPAIVLLLLPPVAVAAQSPSANPVSADIRTTLAESHPPLEGSAGTLYSADLLRQVYAARGNRPGWVSGSGPHPQARTLLHALKASGADGLNPDHYHLEALERLISENFAELPAGTRDRRLASLELLLSDAFLALARDQHDGRVDPLTLEPRPVPSDPHGVPASELEGVLGGKSPALVLRHLAPVRDNYAGLRDALAAYRAIEADGGLSRIRGGGVLSRGDRGARVASVAARLAQTGDLDGFTTGDDCYNAAVKAAVVRFQARHGLRADGVVGPATLAVLNQPARSWIDKLRVNLERIRWLPRKTAATRLAVNIADFRARLYVHNETVLSERVVVGRRYRQTPEFRDQIRYLVVNPAWDVPRSIAAETILPAVKRDPGYLDRHGYEVLQGWGAREHRVDPARVRWRRLSPSRVPYHFRQMPGPTNPLGRVEFVFPNRYDVYMHDTPERWLFDSRQRTFSHGCIRVEHAMRLAAELLRLDGREHPGLDLIGAADDGKPRRIDLRAPIPISIVYRTAWVDHTGGIQFRPDVYGRDARVLAALAAPGAASR